MFQLTSFDGRFQIDGKETFIRAGEYHYFRVDPEFWEKDLLLLKEEGKLNCISTYVPWIFHEMYEDYFDFDGETHPRRNLRLFLDICRKLNLPVIFRPGPFMYSEYKGFGIPLWVGDLYPEVVVVTVDGEMDKGHGYYNVSLNHPKYLELVKKWYATLAEEFQDYFENPIIIFQIDNETGLMYNFSVGRIDFNEATIEQFHSWLQKNFGNPQTLSVYCVESYLSFQEIVPPMDGLNVAKSMIWQSFFEDWVIEYLTTLREYAMDLGIPILFAINEQGNYFNPSNPIKKAAVAEIYGYNITSKTARSFFTQDIPFSNSIVPSIFKGYLQPEYQALFAAEIGCGWFDPRVKVSNEATVQLMMGSIAHGAKGLCMYVVRDGEDIEGQKYHYHGMINNKSKKLPRFNAVGSVFRFLENANEELSVSEQIYDEIAFATYAMNHRIISGDFDPTGKIIRPIKIIMIQAEYGILGMLLANGYNPQPIALEKISLKEMKKQKVIFFHNRGAIIKSDYTKLIDYVKDGGNLVTGPNFPVMNEHGFPMNTQKLYPAVVSTQRIFGRYANIIKIIRSYITYQIQKGFLKNYNEYSLFHIEKNERHNILRSWKPWGAMAQTKDGKKLHIDYLAREFAWQSDREDIQPVLKLRNMVIGYKHQIGKGTNSVYGTPLGARYVIDSFYRDSKNIKKQNREFLEDLLQQFSFEKTFDANVEIEIVGRYNKKTKSLFVFLLNRGKKKEGIFKILIPAKTRLPNNQPLKVEVLYSYFNSEIDTLDKTLDQLQTEGLKFKIKKDDSLVIKISPK
ncbi:MAG: beta-galactosidase [Candidatus Thorarchaeota archaeon]